MTLSDVCLSVSRVHRA